ncbi:S8 family serine peptidase [Tamlana sp. 2201CG12-4]|uniref:S8 family serine peptidase n=1 Tax=Tamlana sp. 2201CG12-4 TaxID=3112582 RepID=UPI002DBFE0E1|nr:S8 family serine peptidase [Tamlana sp. 2201CG12-4]MEC3907715.1 S8 family serine peptidase [Tamlana sp. 2201CG12-4]
MKKGLLIVLLFFSCLNALAQEDAWVYLLDKKDVTASIANPISILSQKAINRKALHNIPIDERDVPVDEDYIAQLKSSTGITVKAKSKWFNAVHVRGSIVNIQALDDLSFVSHIEFADKDLNTSKTSKEKLNSKFESVFTDFNYGNAFNQIDMLNGHILHQENYTGAGMTVAVLDAGFPNVNIMSAFERLRSTNNLLGSYDFVNREEDVYTNNTSNHGTLVLSTMAGFIQDQFVGTAPDAGYFLFITEDATSETPVEESYWVEAAERADSLGVDVINTSLGYTTYDNPNYSYSPSDMNGNTAYITKGANIAFEKGMLLVTSAGNSGNDSWQIVGAPADASGVLSIGAVNANGAYAFFSSKGSAAQPNQKPDVVAQGLASYVITENNTTATSNGTSFSSPIMAGAVTCLWQALPDKNNEEIMQLVREYASQYENPDNFLGYGIPDFEKALNAGLGFGNVPEDTEELIVFPSPTTGKLYISGFIDSSGLAKLYLFDIWGKKISEFDLNRETDDNIDLSFLSSGLYILNTGENKTFKIVKQ